MDAGGIQLHDALRNQVLMYPPQLGPLLPVLGDDCLLIELVSQIPILVLEHGAAAREYEEGHDSASRSHQSLLSDSRLRAATPRRRGKGPQAPSFGAAGAHVRATGAWRAPRQLCSHRPVGAAMPHLGLRSQVPLAPPSAGS